MSEAGPGAPAERLRFRYTKLGKIRFTSQRDVARMWERALRRSGLPVAWTEGFSPRPLLSFGLALPTGHESLAEYVDVRLDPASSGVPPHRGLRGTEEPELLAQVMTALLPDGLSVVAAASVGVVGSLQQEVTSCTWELEVRGVALRELSERIERLLDAPSVPVRRERKGHWVVDDLRPSVLRLAPIPTGAREEPVAQVTHRIVADLATQPRGVRPVELLDGLGGDLALVRARRTHQWVERDGLRAEPLAPGTPPSLDRQACRGAS
ncbi:MAG TPA: TIGR03936 family radical SAM-associated protein [Acidimicrobiales bacterium]|nr:TIGR03936 family radical SAM-associated protein [Acidimicrobiales bacterium]